MFFPCHFRLIVHVIRHVNLTSFKTNRCSFLEMNLHSEYAMNFVFRQMSSLMDNPDKKVLQNDAWICLLSKSGLDRLCACCVLCMHSKGSTVFLSSGSKTRHALFKKNFFPKTFYQCLHLCTG